MIIISKPILTQQDIEWNKYIGFHAKMKDAFWIGHEKNIVLTNLHAIPSVGSVCALIFEAMVFCGPILGIVELKCVVVNGGVIMFLKKCVFGGEVSFTLSQNFLIRRFALLASAFVHLTPSTSTLNVV